MVGVHDGPRDDGPRTDCHKRIHDTDEWELLDLEADPLVLGPGLRASGPWGGGGDPVGKPRIRIAC
ncbi:MAG: hypothetical protein H8D72_00575 [Planctomycetes bacterium]|nr:hypothetical protein [Planctomycetota bacterium]